MAFLFAEVDVMNDFLLHHVRGHYPVDLHEPKQKAPQNGAFRNEP